MPSFLHTFTFALLAQPLPFALLYLHVVPSFIGPLSHLQKKKALKVCLESFSLEKRQALWVEKTFEHLPRRRKALPNN